MAARKSEPRTSRAVRRTRPKARSSALDAMATEDFAARQAKDARTIQDRWLEQRLEAIESKLEKLGLERECWRAVEVDYPYVSDMLPPPENFYTGTRTSFDFKVKGAAELAQYIDRYRDAEEWIDAWSLCGMANALDWALRSRSAENRFLAGRLFEAFSAFLYRRQVQKVAIAVSTRKNALPAEFKQAVNKLYEARLARGRRHNEACRDVHGSREFSLLCEKHGRAGRNGGPHTTGTVRKMIEKIRDEFKNRE